MPIRVTVVGAAVVTPPPPPPAVGPVTAARVTATTTTSISLGWTNPTDTGFAGVLIRRATGATPPADPTSGTLVYDGSGTSVTDSGLSASTQYSYSMWAHDGSPTYSRVVNVQATTGSPPPSTVLYGASPGSTGWSAAETDLHIKIARAYNGAGSFPAWGSSGGGKVPRTAGVPVIADSVKPDVPTMAVRNTTAGSAYMNLVAQAKATQAARPNTAAERHAMWHEPFSKSFTAAQWAQATINYMRDVLDPVNAARTHPITFYLCIQGSCTLAQQRQFFDPVVAARRDVEIGVDCYQLAQFDQAHTLATGYGLPLCIPEMGFGVGVTHTDAQLNAYMNSAISKLQSYPELTWAAWFLGAQNSLISQGDTLSIATWKALCDA